MIVLAWSALAVGLLAIELHHLAFFAMFGSIGAAVAALVAWRYPHGYPSQLGAAFAATAVGIVLVRPYVSRAFAGRSEGRVAVGVHGGLVGEEVLVVDLVTADPGGHVRLLGETWLAQSATDEALVAGAKAFVQRVRGTTLFVVEVQ